MTRRWNTSTLVLSLSVALAVPAQAQQSWSSILSNDRAANWSSAGATIGNSTTQCGPTIAPYSGSASTINSAIASCASGQFVQLGAGTFTLSSGINFANKSNVTVRGAGAADSGGTILTFTGDVSCGGFPAVICVGNADTNWVGGPANGPINWTGGYSNGTTTITLASTPTNLRVGNLILLDQNNSSTIDQWPDMWVCVAASICSQEGGGAGGRSGRTQLFHATVTNVNGTSVTIAEPLNMPNWRSSQSTQAWWATTNISGVGIENIQIRAGSSPAQWGIVFNNAKQSWVKGVQSRNTKRAHVMMVLSNHITVRDSYFYGTANSSSQSYGVENYSATSSLIENNIFHHIVAPLMFNGPSIGSVASYNYAFDHYYTGSPITMMGTIWMHEGGTDKVLIEGNSGTAFFGDAVHGNHHFVTVFRNRFVGWETGKSSQTMPFIIKAHGRFFNLIGNILGREGYHNGYQSGTYPIYALGDAPSPMTSGYDSNVPQSLMRWGNYDTVTGGAKWQQTEIPSGISLYANPVPGSQTLPPSFYLSAKPVWFGNLAWPPIGPDVLGGTDTTAPAGKANKIPAQVCYERLTKDTNQIGTNFSALTCYGTGGGSTGGSVPPPPGNLQVS